MVQKVTVITGAAQGICKALAIYLANLGHSIVIADQQKEKGIQVSLEIQKKGGHAIFHEVDLRDTKSIKDLIERVTEEFGQIDCLVNGARSYLREKSLLPSIAEWDDALQVMLKAPAVLILESLPLLKKANFGSVINLASTNAFLISQQPISYHVAKAGLIQLTKSMAVKLGPEKIRINAICPGLVDVEERSKITSQNKQHQRIIQSVVPLGEPCTVNQIGAMIAFLSSCEARNVTGQSFVIDGGMTLVDQYHACARFNNFDKETQL